MHVAAPQLVVEQERMAAVANESAPPLATETAELVKLLALKSGLMTDLLTGRVRVPHGNQKKLARNVEPSGVA